ncbi:MAG: hypothetical protein GY803_23015, partial [Chloroflexi bacterium]|nr:hypothetical protein [Chloroflexota bacterium]
MMPTVWGIAYDLSGEWWAAVGLLLAAAVTAVIGWITLTDREIDETALISLGVVGSLMVTPYTWVYEHLLLFIPIVFIYLKWERRWLARIVYALLTFILPWVLFYIAKERWGIDTWTLLVPLLTGFLFYLTCFLKT